MVLVQMPMCNGTDTWGSGRSLTVLCTDGSASASAAFVVLVADMLGGCGCGCEILGEGVAAGALGFLWRRAEENRALRAHANVAGDNDDVRTIAVVEGAVDGVQERCRERAAAGRLPGALGLANPG
jgi:hypothetical protein